jgi:type II secretory pathway component PulK
VTARRPPARGAALLIALAAATGVATLAAGALPLAGGQSRAAHAALAQAQAARLAEAAVHRAVAALADPRERRALPRDGAVVQADFMGARLTLSAQDVAGLVDLNAADEATLARLMRVAGADPDAARRAAAALAAARSATPDRPAFAAPEAALAALDPSDAALLRAAADWTTVWSGAATVNLWTAPAPALAAAGDASLQEAQTWLLRRAALGRRAGAPPFDARRLSAETDGARTRLTARIETPEGGRAQAQAVVEVSAARPERWRILAWR